MLNHYQLLREETQEIFLFVPRGKSKNERKHLNKHSRHVIKSKGIIYSRDVVFSEMPPTHRGCVTFWQRNVRKFPLKLRCSSFDVDGEKSSLVGDFRRRKKR